MDSKKIVFLSRGIAEMIVEMKVKVNINGVEEEQGVLKYVLENCRLGDYNTPMRQLIRHMPSKWILKTLFMNARVIFIVRPAKPIRDWINSKLSHTINWKSRF